jgi:hypothetical protein
MNLGYESGDQKNWLLLMGKNRSKKSRASVPLNIAKLLLPLKSGKWN